MNGALRPPEVYCNYLIVITVILVIFEHCLMLNVLCFSPHFAGIKDKYLYELYFRNLQKQVVQDYVNLATSFHLWNV